MRVLLIALLAAISYAQTGTEFGTQKLQKIVIIRHGMKTKMNIGQMEGWGVKTLGGKHRSYYEAPLLRGGPKQCANYLWAIDSKGRNQARLAMAELREKCMTMMNTHVFISPWKRTIETAMPFLTADEVDEHYLKANIDICIGETNVACYPWSKDNSYEWLADKTADNSPGEYTDDNRGRMYDTFHRDENRFNKTYKDEYTSSGCKYEPGDNGKKRAKTFAAYLKSSKFSQQFALVVTHDSVAKKLAKALVPGSNFNFPTGGFVILTRNGDNFQGQPPEAKPGALPDRPPVQLESSYSLGNERKTCRSVLYARRERVGQLGGDRNPHKDGTILKYDYVHNQGILYLPSSADRPDACVVSFGRCDGGSPIAHMECKILEEKKAEDTRVACPKHGWKTVLFKEDWRYKIDQVTVGLNNPCLTGTRTSETPPSSCPVLSVKVGAQHTAQTGIFIKMCGLAFIVAALLITKGCVKIKSQDTYSLLDGIEDEI